MRIQNDNVPFLQRQQLATYNAGADTFPGKKWEKQPKPSQQRTRLQVRQL